MSSIAQEITFYHLRKKQTQRWGC